MNEITRQTKLGELAAIITTALELNGINAILTGGAVVSIYTENEYESKDLDFISTSSHRTITAAMNALGFSARGKDFAHPESEFTVEFPAPPLSIGNREPVKADGEITVNGTKIKLLSPTQSVMDRLCGFFYHRDRQCLDQAVSICLKQPVDLKDVEKFAKEENEMEKHGIFIEALKAKTPLTGY